MANKYSRSCSVFGCSKHPASYDSHTTPLWRRKNALNYTEYLTTFPAKLDEMRSERLNQIEICVIGAGFAGLAVMGALRRNGIKFHGYEADDDLGGNWKHGVYETVHIISSKSATEYKDYPMPENYPTYPSKDQMLEYLMNYAEHFKLRPNISFNTKVTKATPTNDHSETGDWDVFFEDGSSRRFGGVIVANGHHWDCRWAGPYPGDFTGEHMHSKTYKGPDQLRGKRVLVIGSGNSACDIASEAARFGASSDITMRHGAWFMPRTIMGKPTTDLMLPWIPIEWQKASLKRSLNTIFGPYESYGLPKPDHEPFDKHPTVNNDLLQLIKLGKIAPQKPIKRWDGNTVEFENGVRKEYDLVVHATGFKVTVDVVPEEALAWRAVDDTKDKVAELNHVKKYPSLVLNMCPTDAEIKNVFIFGLTQVRYGAGPFYTSGAEVLCHLFNAQQYCKKPIGYILKEIGYPLLDNYLQDPSETFNNIIQIPSITEKIIKEEKKKYGKDKSNQMRALPTSSRTSRRVNPL